MSNGNENRWTDNVILYIVFATTALTLVALMLEKVNDIIKIVQDLFAG